MKLKICDVCYYEQNKKTTPSRWRCSIKSVTGEKQAIDACDNHKGFFKGMKYDDARAKVHALYGIK